MSSFGISMKMEAADNSAFEGGFEATFDLQKCSVTFTFIVLIAVYCLFPSYSNENDDPQKYKGYDREGKHKSSNEPVPGSD